MQLKNDGPADCSLAVGRKSYFVLLALYPCTVSVTVCLLRVTAGTMWRIYSHDNLNIDGSECKQLYLSIYIVYSVCFIESCYM